VGLALLLYPSAAGWSSALHHDAELSGYVDDTQRTDPQVVDQLVQDAHTFNSAIAPGQIRDPVSDPTAPDALDEAEIAYRAQLRLDETGVMGQLTYPEVDVNLPIYHGTTDEVLSKGVGHLYGSSLPVGGPDTHSLLTSHSGLVNAPLFTNVLEAEVGDVFSVTVLDQTAYYQVRDLLTVLPSEVGSLVIEPGEDLVTLITCTPIGVNTHRLLVTAVRIDAPPETLRQDEAVDGDRVSTPFPTWIVLFVGGTVVLTLAIRAGDRALARPRSKTTDRRRQVGLASADSRPEQEPEGIRRSSSTEADRELAQRTTDG
jgi:sortase A